MNALAMARTQESVPTGQTSPTVRVIGATKVQLLWDKPDQPNGEITKFEIHLTQSEGEEPAYSGIPKNKIDGKFTVNITELSSDSTFEFTVTSFTSAGAGARSIRSVAKTGSSDPSSSTATLIATVCVLVVVLSIGFMWEHRLRQSRNQIVQPKSFPAKQEARAFFNGSTVGPSGSDMLVTTDSIQQQQQVSFEDTVRSHRSASVSSSSSGNTFLFTRLSSKD